MRLAALLWLLMASPALATGFGINCTPSGVNQCAGGAPGVVAVAQALDSTIVRVRVTVPHPIYDGAVYGSGAVGELQADFDPIQAAACTPDTNGCPATLLACPSKAYGLKLVKATGFGPTDVITTDFLPQGTTLCNRTGQTIYTTTLPTAYIAVAKLNSVALGASGTIALATAAGIGVDMTIFNSISNGGASDGPIVDQHGAVCTSTACDDMFKARVAYLINQIAPTTPYVISASNEEDGGTTSTCPGLDSVNYPPAAVCSPAVTPSYNGDTGDGGFPNGDADMHAYLQKLHDICIVAHQFGLLCTDSGLMSISTQEWYWQLEFEVIGTTQSMLEADIFQQGGFSKNAGQFSKQSKLPNSCDIFSPGLTANGYLRIARYTAILNDDTLVGPQHADYVNTHWYDIPWQTYLPALLQLQTTSDKPLMANEFGAYSQSAVDALEKINGARLAGLVYAEWWNEESTSNPVVATALTDPYAGTDPATVPLRGNGQDWVSNLTTNYPTLLSGVALPLPFQC